MTELKIRSKWRSGAFALLFAGAKVLAGQTGVFPPDRPPPAFALNQLPVPLPANLADFVANRNAAIVLGKALFWDQQGGSDGLACASCHFWAGADNRIKNQIDPGLRNVDPTKQNIFNLTATFKGKKASPITGGPNYNLKTLDFPFHQLTDPLNRNSVVLFDTDDVVSSQGVFRADFDHMNVAGNLKHKLKKLEVCNAVISPTFNVGGVNTRQVEPRNTPTVINAIFNFRDFFDGRANNVFNGRNPFGPRDPTAGIDPLNSVLVADSLGQMTPLAVSIPDAGLASQAVGPPGSNLEMSCNGRVFEEIGKKMLQLKPLSLQEVDATDSVLGTYVNPPGVIGGAGKKGLTITYDALIKQAFPSKFWSSTKLTGDGYRQIEKNFSLFWGLSILLYESTLVSDNAPFDQYMNGNISAMTTQQATGFQIFNGNGGCVFCHAGPEFTSAASSLKLLSLQGGLVEHMIMGDGTKALYDSGFYNIGVRPPGDDIGIGGLDPWGNPLNFTRQAKNTLAAGVVGTNFFVLPDGFTVATCNFQVDPCFPVTSTSRDAVDGAMKVPTLRNIELTGPYFHNGGQATLEQVVDFYNRGGDGAGTEALNTTGFGINPTNRAPAIFPLNLSATDKAAVVAFLKSLTDERVRWERAPFDHPALAVPDGEVGDTTAVTTDPTTGFALDMNRKIPAVGAAGRAALGLPALVPFGTGIQ